MVQYPPLALMLMGRAKVLNVSEMERETLRHSLAQLKEASFFLAVA